MDSTLLIVALVAFLAVGLGLWAVFGRRASSSVDELVKHMALSQAEMAGRLQVMQEGQAQLSRSMEERLETVTKRLGDGLSEHSKSTGDVIKQVHERLAVIDTAQKNLTDLSDQVTSLQALFSNKQARGAFGEIQLNDLVRDALPSSAYTFQATLNNGKRADCLLKLPNPPGSIVIDAKFPLESFRALHDASDDAARTLAGRQFSADVKKHIKDIAEKYIVPGETAESALMFLPSEAIYAELHTNFGNVIEEGHRKRVWIVSPSTLMATLMTVRAVLKDARMREQAGLIQSEVIKLTRNVELLDERTEKVRKYFDLADKAIEGVETSSKRIRSDVARVEKIQLDDETPAADLAPATAEPSLSSPKPDAREQANLDLD